MFNTISWHSYWISLAIITAGYYLLVIAIYFRKDLFVKLISPGKGIYKGQAEPILKNSNDESTEVLGNEEMILQAIVDELHAFFDQQKKSKAEKSALLIALHHILQKYPSLRNSQYQESLTNLIISECEHICSVHLKAEDVVHMWMEGG